MNRKRKSPAVVYEDGKPSAVILELEDYRELLERAEDIEDLKVLEEMRRKPLQFRSLDEFLAEHDPGV